MRCEEIRSIRAKLSSHFETLTDRKMGVEAPERFQLNSRETVRRRLTTSLSMPLLLLRQRSIRAELGLETSLPVDLFCRGQRWWQGAGRSRLGRLMRGQKLSRVLVEGCHVGDEAVQFWLRRGVPRVDGIDILSFQDAWRSTVPKLRKSFGAEVSFQQASVDKLPFADSEFDLVASAAVLEHVRNLDAMASESARVLRPGGWAYHEFGPLYYSWGGDHCIPSYGEESGYDHILLSEVEYRQRIEDREFFSRQADPLCNAWAIDEQFSFARTEDYLAAFRPYFDVRFLVVMISPQGLSFRKLHPAEWQSMLRSGLTESDLLFSCICLILQRKCK
jgi:SAM-dependent methyltransferase